MMVEVPPVAPAECARIEDALVWACRAYDTLEGGSTLEGSSAEVLAAVAALLPSAATMVAAASECGSCRPTVLVQAAVGHSAGHSASQVSDQSDGIWMDMIDWLCNT